LFIRHFPRLAVHAQLLPLLESGEETLIGGQAVMEGVMMRAPHSYCVAVRKPSGEIVCQEAPLAKVSAKYPIFKYPLVRGVGSLGQALWLGIKALQFSANAALDEGDQGKGSPEIPGWLMGLHLTFSFVFFVFLYKLVPLWLATRLGAWQPKLQGRIAFNMVDGVIRIVIFLGFLYAISLWKDIRRVFEYHGAEHKVVFNFESGEPVTVANAQRFTTFHPRCGTSFLLVVMMISMAVYTLLPFDGFLARFLARIALLPVIAGLSYETVRFAARRRSSLMATLTAPGLWLQRITTKPPSDDQTAVAIRALEGAIALEQAQGCQPEIA
jgi:uncharacterized protein YqhQ